MPNPYHIFRRKKYRNVNAKGILTIRYDLQSAGKLCHLRGQFKKARTAGIPFALRRVFRRPAKPAASKLYIVLLNNSGFLEIIFFTVITHGIPFI